MTAFLPRKRFGQHFLHDRQVIEHLVTVIAPEFAQQLVEIGPGKGALTLPLLAQGSSLILIELDRDLVDYLKRVIPENKSAVIYGADALRFDFRQLPNPPLRIVGNLPYNVATPLLFHLLSGGARIQDMIFMVQKEVAERLVAAPNSRHYGRLSVMVQYYCQVRKLFEVAPGAFYPPPKVDSAVVQLQPHLVPPVRVIEFSCFEQVVSQAFAQRRKTLRNALQGCLTQSDIVTAEVDPQVRAETLGLVEFARLANRLKEVFTIK